MLKSTGTKDHATFIVTESEMLQAIEPTIKQGGSCDAKRRVRASVPMYLLSRLEKIQTLKLSYQESSFELSGSRSYFHKAPSEEFQEECIRLIQDIQHFDVLREIKQQQNGLEIRVPFFDKEFVKYMHIDPSLKMVRNGFEKYLLRSFKDACYHQK